MPANNLARVFGPTLVGHSCPEPEPMQLINETKYQAMVSSDWSCVLDQNGITDDTEETYFDVQCFLISSHSRYYLAFAFELQTFFFLNHIQLINLENWR